MTFKNATVASSNGRTPKYNLSGLRFGRLMVVRHVGSRHKDSVYACICDCGAYVEARASRMKSGNVKSCGCLNAEQRPFIAKKEIRSPASSDVRSGAYASWMSMHRRCYVESASHFERYGGRGIVVCERWKSFQNFLSDMGEKPEGKSLDRINNSGNYEPTNCRWATHIEQSNNRDNNVRISFMGIDQTMQQWSREPGAVSAQLIRVRLRYGWSVERAIFEPPKRRKSKLCVNAAAHPKFSGESIQG